MSRRFVVAVNTLTTEQERAFAQALSASGLDWWHWIQNIWLVIDRSDKFTPEGIRDYLNDIMPGRFSLIMEVQPMGAWAGFGPTGDQMDMGQWIKTSWLADD